MLEFIVITWIYSLVMRRGNRVDAINELRRPVERTSRRIVAAARARLAEQVSDNPA